MTEKAGMTLTDMLSTAREVLLTNGFSEASSYRLCGIDASNQGLYEDSYSLVAIVVFEAWSDLLREWTGAQAAFVDLISEHIERNESKTWDCYLLLWTPGLFPRDKSDEHQAIRYDTGRVRKLIASGAELQELGDVSTALLPLLPITERSDTTAEDSVLDRVPALLESNELPQSVIRAVVNAFHKRESLIEALHNFGKVQ
ncbi:hypothetical protein [Botrimarina mediterranea]|uniref:Uncharacterized protein n=1 Tax=Botrimarina mediterranea TaxID=2528022 RepID=A0A518K916_9BACT|nr:hypothetical protein [Botrimarina mediterranea]QDV74284.1 hypothetical protein Spa11_24850 [Botrimarina mediterranea]